MEFQFSLLFSDTRNLSQVICLPPIWVLAFKAVSSHSVPFDYRKSFLFSSFAIHSEHCHLNVFRYSCLFPNRSKTTMKAGTLLILLGRILCGQLDLLAIGLLVTATGNPFPSWLSGKGLISQSNKFHTPPPASLGQFSAPASGFLPGCTEYQIKRLSFTFAVEPGRAQCCLSAVHSIIVFSTSKVLLPLTRSRPFASSRNLPLLPFVYNELMNVVISIKQF